MNRVALSLVLIGSMAFFSCQQKAPPPPNPPTPVNLMAVKARPVLYYDKYPSTTQALSQVNIYPEVQGYITGIFFKEGAHVKKGQELYEIDKRLFQAAYDQAEANLKVAHGTTVQAKQDYDRYVYLNNQKAVAEQLYDHAVITYQNAENAEKAAAEAVKTAKTNLAYSVIYAPFDGTIGFSQVKLGNMVTVGQTLLNTISTDNPMAVDFLVNEKQLAAFNMLENGKKGAPDSLFTILMPDNTPYPYPGKISIIDRAVDPQTGAIRIRLEFPNPDYTLRVGMSCVVRVHNQEQTPQMVIPSKAVVEQMGEYFVFIKKDTLMPPHASSDQKKEEDKKDGKQSEKVLTAVAIQKKVQLGMTIAPNVIVKSGIEEGDSVITDGVQNLHDGSRINAAGKKPVSDSTKKQGGTQ
jgi:RND family efflux transporter MFP subunit